MSGRLAQQNATQGSECPVCLEPFQPAQCGSNSGDRTEARSRTARRRSIGRFSFPCGHGICTGCNERMLQRNNLVCPLCRTPRAGVSAAEAARAAEFQTVIDRQHEADEPRNGDGDPFQSAVADGVGVGGIVQRAGRRYEVIFFVNQATGDPAEPLDSAAQRLQERIFEHNGQLFSSNGRARSGGRAVRRPRRPRASPLGPSRADNLHEPERQADEPEGADEDDGITMLHRPFEIPAADVNLNALIGHLLSPTSIGTFLAARERV